MLSPSFCWNTVNLNREMIYSPLPIIPGTPVFPSPFKKQHLQITIRSWNARTLLNEFLWTPWCSVGKHITITLPIGVSCTVGQSLSKKLYVFYIGAVPENIRTSPPSPHNTHTHMGLEFPVCWGRGALKDRTVLKGINNTNCVDKHVSYVKFEI